MAIVAATHRDRTGLPWLLPSPHAVGGCRAWYEPGMVGLEEGDGRITYRTNCPVGRLGAPWLLVLAGGEVLVAGQVGLPETR